MFAVFHQLVMNLMLMCVKSGPLIEKQVAWFARPYLVRGSSVERLATLAVRAHQMPLQHLLLLERKWEFAPFCCALYRTVWWYYHQSLHQVQWMLSWRSQESDIRWLSLSPSLKKHLTINFTGADISGNLSKEQPDGILTRPPGYDSCINGRHIIMILTYIPRFYGEGLQPLLVFMENHFYLRSFFFYSTYLRFEWVSQISLKVDKLCKVRQPYNQWLISFTNSNTRDIFLCTLVGHFKHKNKCTSHVPVQEYIVLYTGFFSEQI